MTRTPGLSYAQRYSLGRQLPSIPCIAGAFSDGEEKVARWQAVAEKWRGVVAVGGHSRLRLVLTRPNQPYLPLFTIEVPPTQKAVCLSLYLNGRRSIRIKSVAARAFN